MTLSELFERIRPLAESRISAVVFDPGGVADEVTEAPPRYALFASLCDGRRRATVVHACDDDPVSCWKRITELAQRAANIRQLQVHWLRVDWVTRAVPMTVAELKRQLESTKRNYFRHGLALDARLQVAFLEQELNANAMLYGGSQIPHAALNEHNFGVYLRTRFRRAWARLDGRPFALEDTKRVYRLDTAGVFCAADAPAPLPLHPTGPRAGRRELALDPDSLHRLIDDGSRYLASQVQPSGRFHYGWHPCFDRAIPTYNSLRHASSTYAMIEAWEVTRRPALRQAVERALGYLTSTLIHTVDHDGQGDARDGGQGDHADTVNHDSAGDGRMAFLVDTGDEIKLGGNAVCLLALSKYTEVTGDDRYLPLLERLARGILHMQDPASGRFVHVLRFPDLAVKEPFRIIYYDGEAAFGLMRLYGLTRDPRWLRAVEAAFEHFIAAEHWRAHDHWLSYCVNELTRYRPDPRYYEFGLRNVADYLDFVQNRITTFPTLLELMNAAASMLARLQASPELRHLLERIDLPKFQRAMARRAERLLDGHFWPEYAMYFRNPEKIVGSFFIRHHAFRVRIDDVEHYLSGLVGYRKHLLESGQNPALATAG